MYHKDVIDELILFISNQNTTDKRRLSSTVQQRFHLAKKRSVFYCEYFAIRFCSAASKSFGNTVLALSALRKYDHLPFIVCLVTPAQKYFMLANTTFLKKVSHSSQELRQDNIKGSFNGSDIMREFEGVENSPDHFAFLFSSHESYTFAENLARLIEATNNIAPTGQKFMPSETQTACIQKSVDRTLSFFQSAEYRILSNDLKRRVNAVTPEIAIAARIDNVNLRGRVIEYLITAEDDLKADLIQCLRAGKELPEIFTADKLGDYRREFADYLTETDIKSKALFLSGNPKGYNIDKFLSFLAEEKSVYLVYIVAIGQDGTVQTQLCSPFHRQLLSGTRIIRHWAGRNSRGVTQYDGNALETLVKDFDPCIDIQKAQDFLADCLHSGTADSSLKTSEL